MAIDSKSIESFVKKTLETKNKKETFIPGKTLIPPSGKLIGHEEIKNMVLASFDGWLTTGRFNTQFQENLSKFLKCPRLPRACLQRASARCGENGNCILAPKFRSRI